jgi:hypothetical protein
VVLFAAGFSVFLAVSFVAAALWLGGPTPIQQPVEFSHRRHVEVVELSCETCHESVRTETFPGLPAADTCAFCHGEPQGESASERVLAQLLADGQPIAWQPLFRQPPHVFFSHRRHVVAAELECSVCHGTFAASERPPTRVRRLTMKDCLGCHERSNVEKRCTSCHR